MARLVSTTHVLKSPIPLQWSRWSARLPCLPGRAGNVMHLPHTLPCLPLLPHAVVTYLNITSTGGEPLFGDADFEGGSIMLCISPSPVKWKRM